MSRSARPKRYSIRGTLAGLALAGAFLAVSPAFAGWPAADVPPLGGEAREPDAPIRVENVRMADADCSAAAAEAAAQTGGQVLSVSSRDDGGRTVCIVTVLVPGEDGERPRKRTLTLPQ